MRNERLRAAITAGGLTTEGLAEAVQVDPKSVWRWLNKGVVPRRVGLKAKVADLLGVTEAAIWPAPAEVEDADEEEATEEVVRAWSHRADVPKTRWWAMFTHASEHIDLLGYAMQFLPEDHARLDRLLLEKAGAGCRVRIALADPDSTYVAERDAEEGLGGTFRDRIRSTIDHFKPLFGVDGIELRFHCTPMYNSLFRGDDEMFITPHLYALKGYRAPIFFLRRSFDDGIFDGFVAHFERLWATTEPIPSP
ncbi:MAG TPA: XRE family transcriptional regulator [Acidimicrobiia bacterium]|nr:XRE family transcriptional regulator [Acidimicrobiia bacterium]